jgi:hypothetical protein
MANQTHSIPNVDFASFINSVMWHRANARVWAGPMDLCFSWQGANGRTYAAFRFGTGVKVYRAMDAKWPVAPWGLCPTRRERRERLNIGPFAHVSIVPGT